LQRTFIKFPAMCFPTLDSRSLQAHIQNTAGQQAPVAERPVALPPEHTGSSHAAITHFRSVLSGHWAAELSQMRHSDVAVSRRTRSTLARQAHIRVPGVRLLGRGHCPIWRRL